MPFTILFALVFALYCSACLPLISLSQYELKFRRWGFRKNAIHATRHPQWRPSSSTNAASLSVPESMAGPEAPVVTAFRERSHAGKKQARPLVPAAPIDSQAPVSTQAVREADATSMSIPNEPAALPEPWLPEFSQPETTPPDRRDAGLLDEAMNVSHDLLGLPGEFADFPGEFQAHQSVGITSHSPGLFLEYGESMAYCIFASDDDLPGSSSQGLVDAPITRMDISGASLLSPPAALHFQPEDIRPASMTWDEPAFLRAVGLPPSNNTTYFGTFVANDIWQALPFARLEERLQLKGIVLDRVAGGLMLLGFAGILSSGFQSIVRRPSDKQNILRKLGSMFPGEHSTGSALITPNHASETKFARMLLLSMINGFAGLNDVPVENILNLFNSVGVSKLLLYVLEQSPKHTARTIADNIFRAAVEAGDTKVVMLLLKSKLVDVNETVCVGKERCSERKEKATPLERAAALESLALVQSLIAEGADVNKTYTNADWEGLGGALTKLIEALTARSPKERTHQSMTPELVDTLNLLFDAGARVHPWHLGDSLYRGPIPGLAWFLSLRIRPENHKEFFKDRPGSLICAAAHSSDHEGTQVFQQLINLCTQADCNNCLVEARDEMNAATICAAGRGHIEFVQLLFSTAIVTPQLPGILAAAIRSSNRALIDHILTLSNDLDPPAADLSSGGDDYTTPIAEALRDGNEDLIRLLEERGALDHLTEGGRFGVLLKAAAQEDDSAYLKKILARAVTSKQAYRANSRPLELAANGDVIRMLLEAGAESAGPSNLDLSPLKRALELRDKRSVYDLIEVGISDVRAVEMKHALEWGDNSVIAVIIREFPHAPVASVDIQHLCWTCVKEKKIEGFKGILRDISNMEDGGLEKCLTTAVELGHIDMINYLLGISADPCDPGVLKAAIPDRPEILRLLFQEKESRQKVRKGIGARTLQFAIGNGVDHAKALEELLITQAIDFTGLEYLNDDAYHTWQLPYNIRASLTPLGLAIEGSPKHDTNLAAMGKFIDAGANPDGIAKMNKPNVWIKDSFPLRTALTVAVEAGHEDAVKMLLRHGADIDARPCLRTTRTPLQYAAEIGNADMVHLLLNPGELSVPADVNSPPATRGGGTALQFAAMSGNCNIAAELLRHGAQLDSRPSKVDGRWPLEGAAEKGRLDMIQFLWEVSGRALAAGVTCDGFTERQCLRAMNFARMEGHFGCRDLISELSGIHVGRLETDEYGAPWIAY